MDDFTKAQEKVRKLLKERGRLVVAIDGYCGSGKTRLGELLQAMLGGNLFHTDDFYLPFERRSPDWKKVPARNMDIKRLREEVFIPAHDGDRIVYGAYDAHRRKLKSIAVAPEPLSVIEGSYSHHPVFAACTDFKIFIKCDDETQKKRLQEREGQDISSFEELWIPLERQFFEDYRIEERSDLVLDTSDRDETPEKPRPSEDDAQKRRRDLAASVEFFKRSSYWNRK